MPATTGSVIDRLTTIAAGSVRRVDLGASIIAPKVANRGNGCCIFPFGVIENEGVGPFLSLLGPRRKGR
jgi:hypothetical protein